MAPGALRLVRPGPGQRVLYVTERAVFELRGGRMTLTEIAPGIDLNRDVLAQMDFEPAIASDLAAMERGIFYPRWGALRLIIESKAAGARAAGVLTAS